MLLNLKISQQNKPNLKKTQLKLCMETKWGNLKYVYVHMNTNSNPTALILPGTTHLHVIPINHINWCTTKRRNFLKTIEFGP